VRGLPALCGWIVAPAVAVALLLAGCGGQSRHVSTASPTTTGARSLPPAARAALSAPVRVEVIDGDTGLPVRDALVTVRGAARRGRFLFAWPRARSELVSASAPRYTTLRQRVDPGRARSVTLRLYQPAGQWLMYGVTESRTQDQTAIALRPPFRITWGRSLGSLIEFPAVVDDGVAYVSNGSGELFALSMRDGRTLWSYNMDSPQEASSPAVVGSRLVAHAKDGRVLVFQRASGRLLWSHTTDGEIESSPVVDGGVDYLGDWSGHIYALDLATHRFRWVYDDGCKITASATVAGGTVYIGDYCGRIVALRRSSGRLLWSAQTGSPVYGASAYADGEVFVPSRDTGALFAFSAAGAELWHVSTGDTVYSAPAVWQGRVYFGSYNGTLYAVSARSGSVLWQLPVGGRISGSATVVDGVVYIGSFDHHIIGADAVTGKVLFNFPHGEYVAVSGNRGRLLLYGWSTLWAVEARR
jgi:outer membrane protein assembly factor BamB